MAFPLGGGHLLSARCRSLACGEEMLVLARMQEWADGGVRVLSPLRWDGLIGDLSDFRFVRALVRSLLRSSTRVVLVDFSEALRSRCSAVT